MARETIRDYMKVNNLAGLKSESFRHVRISGCSGQLYVPVKEDTHDVFQVTGVKKLEGTTLYLFDIKCECGERQRDVLLTGEEVAV